MRESRDWYFKSRHVLDPQVVEHRLEEDEAHEIANYTSIASLAEALGDTETAKAAKAIIREEQRMQKYLEGLIPRLTKSVVNAEIPSRERKPQPSRFMRSALSN